MFNINNQVIIAYQSNIILTIDNHKIDFALTCAWLKKYLEYKVTEHLYAFELDSKLAENIANTLYENISKFITPTIIFEYNLCVQNKLFVNNGINYFDQFFNFTKEIEWLDYFDLKYSALNTRVGKYIQNNLEYLHEIVCNLSIYNEEIDQFFNVKLELNKLTNIQLGSGDLHNGNRSTAILIFTDFKLVYKPRIATSELKFKEFLQELNKLGLQYESKIIPEILNCEHFSIWDFIQHKPCHSPTQVANYYYNIGILIAITNLIGVYDIHYENLIAVENSPVLIDIECLLNGTVSFTSKKFTTDAGQKLTKSIINTGFLQKRTESKGYSHDFGVLNPNTVHKQNVTEYTLNKEGLVEQKIILKEFNKRLLHFPSINDTHYNSEKYINDLINGYELAFDFIKENKLKIADFIVCLFKNLKVRYLLRDTFAYDKILENTLIPTCSASFDYVSDIFKVITKHDRSFNIPEILSKCEYQQIINYDIPIFYAFSDSNHLFDYSGNVIVYDYFLKNGIEFYFNNLISITDFDKTLNLNILKMSLGLNEPNYESLIREQSKNENLNYYCEKINIEVLNKIISASYSKNLYNIQALSIIDYVTDENMEVSIDVLDYGLYDGLDGIIFYLTYYYQKYEDLAVKNIVLLTVQNYEQILKEKSVSKLFTQNNRYSAFYFPLSFYYIFLHTDYVFGTNYLNKDNLEILYQFIKKKYKEDTDYDFLLGSCGVIVLLLNIHEYNGSVKALKLAIEVADYVVDNSIRKEDEYLYWKSNYDGTNVDGNIGFAHGSSGFAYTFYKLFHITNEIKYKYVYEDVVKFEDTKYDYQSGQWLPDNYTEEYSNDVSWCKSSSGILLSRLHTHKLDIVNYNMAIENLLKSLQTDGLSCICHGKFGNLLVLKDGIEDMVFCKDIEDEILRIINNAISQPIITQYNIPNSLNLFTGFTGLGYSLLRICDVKIPNILILEGIKKL
jgi:type 2 lantibiotic biosynthesis protein LanM